MSNVNANQEDIDLMVCFDDGPNTHVILVEAKGESGWKNGQMLSKARRLARIFPDSETTVGTSERYPGVVPHFLLTSPPGTEPTRLTRQSPDKKFSWPVWMWPEDGKPKWIPLDMPVETRLRIERFDPALNKASSKGVHWHLRSSKT